MLMLIAAAALIFVFGCVMTVVNRRRIRVLVACGMRPYDAKTLLWGVGMPEATILHDHLMIQIMLCFDRGMHIADAFENLDPHYDASVLREGVTLVASLCRASLNGGVRDTDLERMRTWQDDFSAWMRTFRADSEEARMILERLLRWNALAGEQVNAATFIGQELVDEGIVRAVDG